MSSGSNVSDAAVAQIDSSNASQEAAPDITDFCGVPNEMAGWGTGFVTEMTASTDPSISKGLRTCIESGTGIKTQKQNSREAQQLKTRRMLAEEIWV